MCGLALTGALGAATAPAHGLDGPYPLAEVPDPGAAVSMLGEATPNEGTAAAPFLGLAAPITVDPLFGTATTRIPIEIPPGRKLTPDLTIRYSSNGANGLFGVGWDLPLGCIKRNIARGVPWDYTQGVYNDATGFMLVFRGGTVLLDTCADTSSPCTSWKASSEEVWLDAQFNRASNSWRLTDKEDVTWTYGTDVASRTGIAVNDATPFFTVGWYLTKLEDPSGNRIEITYDDRFVQGAVQIASNPYAYPKQIDYSGNTNAGLSHIFHVAFGYDTTRPDVVTTVRYGFAEQVELRVNAITVWVGDGAAIPSNPTRAYTFTYTQDPDTGWSLLASVGEDVAGAPPPTTFAYQASARRLDSSATTLAGTPTGPSSELHPVSASGLLHAIIGFIDVDSDGLPDFFDGFNRDDGGADLYRNRGNGRFEKDPPGAWTSLLIGVWPSIANPCSRLIDMDGDGLPDVLRAPSCTAGALEFFRNIGDPRQRTGTLQTALTPSAWQDTTLLPSHPSGQLSDLNGDGLPDALDCENWTTSNTVCQFSRNTGAGFMPAISWYVTQANDGVTCATCDPLAGPLATTTQQVASPENIPSLRKQVVDINGDGLPDLVSSQPFSKTCGGGTNAGATCTSNAQCPGAACNYQWVVWLNDGWGFNVQMAWPAPPFSATGQPYSIEENDEQESNQLGVTRALRDMNGDGLLDYVDATTPTWTVWLNTGAGFKSDAVLWNNAAGRISRHPQGVAWTDVLDVNGDGIVDRVEASSSGLRAQFGQDASGNRRRPSLLIKEENGLGASWEVSYVPSTDPVSAGKGCAGGANEGAPCLSNAECPSSTCEAPCAGCSQLPFNTWVVQSLTARSGFTGPGNDLTTTYAFTGGYFDPVEHQFRGFRQSLEQRADGRTTRRQFAAPPFATSSAAPWPVPQPARPFKLVDEQVWDGGGKLLGETTVDWDAALLGGRVRVHPTQRIETTFSTDGSLPKVRTVTFNQYDEFNNLTISAVSGSSTDSVPGNDLGPTTTTASYPASGQCHGQPTRVQVFRSSSLLSDRQFTYDSRCNLLSVQAKLFKLGDPPPGTFTTTLSLEYDQGVAAGKAGLPTRVLDARGAATWLSYNTGGEGCSAVLLPCTITNALGQTTQKTYDLRFGKPKSITDPNGPTTTTTFEYDSLGRLTQVFRPLDSQLLPWRTFAYQFGTTGGVPSEITTGVREPNGVGFRTAYTFFDSWGRPLESKQEQAVNGVATVVLTDAVAFDSLGRVAKRYAPQVAPAQTLTQYDPPATTKRGTTYRYDVLDRPIRITNPDRTYRTMDYGVAGRTITTDENYNKNKKGNPGRKTVERRDALGRLVMATIYERQKGLPEQAITSTTTGYDAQGRVVSAKTTDEVSGTTTPPTTFRYDSLGRRVELTDPDSGTWRYGYDVVGNLVYQDDPKTNQHTELCYDPLNRLRRTVHQQGDDPVSGYIFGLPAYDFICLQGVQLFDAIDYAYDYPYNDVCDNGIGRLCEVDEYQVDTTQASVTTFFSYDARGRTTRERKLMQLDTGETGDYTRTFTYDAADRVVSLTYPTDVTGMDEVFSYTYNEFGQLIGAATPGQSYATGFAYDLLGRATAWQDGSGLLHTATYDTTGSRNFRLRGLKVKNPLTGSSYQRFAYTKYDAAGNLLKVQDHSLYVAPNRYDLKNTWRYAYDGLGRLTSAQQTDAFSFTYDGMGNRMSSSWNGIANTYYFSDPAAPHQISRVNNTSGITDYDPNGALTTLPLIGSTPARQVSYDRDGRVLEADTTTGNPPSVTHRVRSVYDYRGERVARIVDGGQASQVVTFYFGRWSELTEFGSSGTSSTLTRHIYLGNQLIAESPLSDSLAPGSPIPVYFVHTDHLGSTTMLTCYNQQPTCADRSISRYFRYDPYGRMTAYTWLGDLVEPGGENTEHLYTGQRWDSLAQLYYYRARFYDPRVANFLTEDPVREYMNPYAYVRWNPVKFTDPTGMIFEGSSIMAISVALTFGENPAKSSWSFRDQINAGLVPHIRSGAGGHDAVPGWVPDWYVPIWALHTLSQQGTAFEAAQALAGVYGGVAAAEAAAAGQAFVSEVAAAAERQGGGVMTVANPVLNASTINDVGSATAGYADANVTLGLLYGGTVGFTSGLMFTNDGRVLAYIGPAAMTPRGGFSFTYGTGLNAPGLAVAFQGTGFPFTGQVGYSFSSGFFSELGGAGPASGFAVSAFYVFGPLN